MTKAAALNSHALSDLEITLLCAEAMGLEALEWSGRPGITATGGVAVRASPDTGYSQYNPIHDNAQAMALVKKFRLLVDGGNAQWCVHGDVIGSGRINDDLNRAICECVARMQKART